MSRLRIVCKPEVDPAHVPSKWHPRVHAPLPDFSNIAVSSISDEGVETVLDNVTAVTFRCAQDGKPATAVLEFADVDVDVEAEVTP